MIGRWLSGIRFGTRTCDFLICRRCGVFIAAVAEMTEGGARSAQRKLLERSWALHVGPHDARVSGRDDRQQIVATDGELDACRPTSPVSYCHAAALTPDS